MNTRAELQTEPMATVYVNGLVILCFNNAQARAEMGFLNSIAETHPMELIIYNSIFVPIATYDHDDLRDTEITIHKGGSGTGSTHPSDPGSPPEEAEDFRWLVDPVELHGFDMRFKSPFPPNSFFSKLFINEGVFFTAPGSITQFPTSIIDHTYSRNTPFRHVGRVVGADIESTTAIEVEIKGPATTVNISLPPENGPYYIVVNYKCDRRLLSGAKLDDEAEGDFDKIYEVLEPSLPFDRRRFNILLHRDEPVWTFLSQIAAKKLNAENKDKTTEKTAEQELEDESKETTETKQEQLNKEDSRLRESCELACQVVYMSGDTALP